MKAKLMLAVSAILLTAVLALALGQQKPEQKAEQKPEQKAEVKPEQKPEEKSASADQKVFKVRAGGVVTIDATKNVITIKDDAGMETSLLLDTSTTITKAGKSITLADLKVGDKISSECADSTEGCKAKSIQVIPPDTSQ